MILYCVPLCVRVARTALWLLSPYSAVLGHQKLERSNTTTVTWACAQAYS